MSATLSLVREFVTCFCLSFVIILAAPHALLDLLHIHFPYHVRLPLASFLAQHVEISRRHEYLIVLCELTFACTTFVFAVREIALALGSLFVCPSDREREVRDLKATSDEKLP
ncbi:hypothetical protein K438DRAFT_1756595 [Mycena galopus ATCC 62051]|nr:hypothetical protein K438DRAFT_1756595 [Mycena galopus ATCC 62051]